MKKQNSFILDSCPFAFDDSSEKIILAEAWVFFLIEIRANALHKIVLEISDVAFF